MKWLVILLLLLEQFKSRASSFFVDEERGARR